MTAANTTAPTTAPTTAGTTLPLTNEPSEEHQRQRPQENHAASPGLIAAPARWSHKRSRRVASHWTCWIGNPNYMPCGLGTLCERQDLAPNPLRGRFSTYQQVMEQRIEAGIWCFSRPIVEEDRRTIMIMNVYELAHVVIGVISKKTGEAHEVVVDNIKREDLFNEIREAVRILRPWWKRFISLKSVQGFSLYRCFPESGHHEAIELDDMAKSVLYELWHEYNRSKKDHGGRWLAWAQENLNQGDFKAADDASPLLVNRDSDSQNDNINEAMCLTLFLVIRWSATKIAIYGLSPILLSLAIGFWFQYTQEGDRIAVVQTAWTISSFIIGASGVTLAVIAAVTQLGDV
ncbi:Fc.00g079520.m01.CDS01 [Cosmosporella sp. VM-42]